MSTAFAPSHARTTAPTRLASPLTLEDTGLTADQVERLFIKALYAGEQTGLALSDTLCLPFPIVEPLIERARAERLVEVRGITGSGTAAYRYALTDLGRDRARQYLDASLYTGAAPVPLAVYTDYMRHLIATRGHVDRERLRSGFAHLVEIGRAHV